MRRRLSYQKYAVCVLLKETLCQNLIECGKVMTKEIVHEAFMMLSGAVTIVYPMGLPPYDPIQAELKNEEDLSGTHASFVK